MNLGDSRILVSHYYIYLYIRCCGHEDRHSCNTDIVNCLANCNAGSLTCTDGGAPVPAGGIELAMGIVESWCCGSQC